MPNVFGGGSLCFAWQPLVGMFEGCGSPCYFCGFKGKRLELNVRGILESNSNLSTALGLAFLEGAFFYWRNPKEEPHLFLEGRVPQTKASPEPHACLKMRGATKWQ